MTPALRALRIRGAWLLLIPFVLLARPTAPLLAAGAAVAAVGTLLRGWAAGSIQKDRALSVAGPYAYTRNPLYLGSFLIGVGASVAAGRWELGILFVAFFAALYPPLMRGEARALERRFGDAYARWAGEVPLFVPRLPAYRAPEGAARAGGFTFARWRRNREYEAVLGVAAGFGFLAVRVWLG